MRIVFYIDYYKCVFTCKYYNVNGIHLQFIFHYLNYNNNTMVFLRNGHICKDGPEQIYGSPAHVFMKETREEFKKKHPNLKTAREAQRQAWDALSEKQKEKYAKLYEASVKEYEERLVMHYGGNKKDVAAAQEINRIPPKPKHPLNSLLIYLNENRDEYMKLNPDAPMTIVTKELSKRFSALSEKQKKPYQIAAKKESEAYEREFDMWEILYGQQFKEGQKVLKAQHRYHSQGKKQPLTYQQILSARGKRKLIPLGDEETKQVGGGEGRGRGRPKKQVPQQQNNRKSTSNARQSRSPSQNPKVTQDQKEQKTGGRGRPKKE
ncbi:hypothetical protein pb186bvf_020401 [Paramecium bursaria]